MPTPNALSERDVRIIEDFVTLIRRQPGVQAPMRLVWMAGHEQVDAVARDFDRLVEDVSKIQTVGAVGIAPSLVLLADVARKVASIPNKRIPSRALTERCLKEFYAPR